MEPVPTVLVVDDHAVVRAGVRAGFASAGRYRVVAEADRVRPALDLARELRPIVVVLDAGLGDDEGVAAIPRFLSLGPPPRVVVFTMHRDRVLAAEAFALGALAFVLKDSSEDVFLRAIDSAAAGDAFLDPRLGGAAAGAGAEVLTERQRTVLALLAEGLTNLEVAGRLRVSLRTVESHRAQIRQVLGASRRADLVRWAREHRLPSPR